MIDSQCSCGRWCYLSQLFVCFSCESLKCISPLCSSSSPDYLYCPVCFSKYSTQLPNSGILVCIRCSKKNNPPIDSFQNIDPVVNSLAKLLTECESFQTTFVQKATRKSDKSSNFFHKNRERNWIDDIITENLQKTTSSEVQDSSSQQLATEEHANHISAQFDRQIGQLNHHSSAKSHDSHHSFGKGDDVFTFRSICTRKCLHCVRQGRSGLLVRPNPDAFSCLESASFQGLPGSAVYRVNLALPLLFPKISIIPAFTGTLSTNDSSKSLFSLETGFIYSRNTKFLLLIENVLSHPLKLIIYSRSPLHVDSPEPISLEQLNLKTEDDLKSASQLYFELPARDKFDDEGISTNTQSISDDTLVVGPIADVNEASKDHKELKKPLDTSLLPQPKLFSILKHRACFMLDASELNLKSDSNFTNKKRISFRFDVSFSEMTVKETSGIDSSKPVTVSWLFSL